MTLVGTAADALEAAQARLAEARKAVVDREEDVQKARAAMPQRIDLVLEDPVLGAAAEPDEEERQLLARQREVEGLWSEAWRTWNREGRRVVESQKHGTGLSLDEDAAFVAATNLLEGYQSEYIELRGRLDLGSRIRIFNASVARFDEGLRERETTGTLGKISSAMQADIRRRHDEAREVDGRKAKVERILGQLIGRAE